MDSIDLSTICLRVAADPGSAAAENGDVVGSIPEHDPLSKVFVNDMKSWLNTCTKGHEKCTRSISGKALDAWHAQLPTRCLRIGSIDDSGSPNCYLEETLGQTGHYVTLSHRWCDTTETSKTTVLNYEERKSGRNLNLPVLFKDTMRLAFKLGIPYVWIDSVCIIQDGNEWESESLKMADYYQQSIFTVAAAIGTDADGLGLTRIPNRLMPRLARLPYYDKSGQQKGYFYVYQSAQKLTESYSLALTNADLLTRGWVFQEWLLSRRIACFASREPGQRIFFQCQSDPPMNETRDVVKVSESGFFFGDHIRFATDSPPVLWAQWQLAVRKYSAASLTQPEKDRIIALAGVAKECCEAIRSLAESAKYREKARDVTPAVQLDAGDRFIDAYVAGLWLRNIHSELLWDQRCDKTFPRKRVPGIPTWSWASILVPVDWGYQDRAGTCSCELHGVLTENGTYLDAEHILLERQGATEVPLAPHGLDVSTKYGILRLWGRRVSVQVLGDFTRDDWNRRDKMSIPGLDISDFADWRNLTKICLASRPLAICGWGSLEHPDFQEAAAGQRLSTLEALAISEYRAGEFGGTYHTVWNVLFVLSVQRDIGQCYERVGMGRISGLDAEKEMNTTAGKDVMLC
ncbi:HET-domain-containing protein [Pleurostoma richardsiae]|uniref:HET-domain-containing protein n=1 Tax=Pleurostoma richardsiae TaxID=41990 RepID=A0AA38VU29_9PEZI|nr:HET-domain-containing protein [Pleurostoma richardsiae]